MREREREKRRYWDDGNKFSSLLQRKRETKNPKGGDSEVVVLFSLCWWPGALLVICHTCHPAESWCADVSDYSLSLWGACLRQSGSGVCIKTQCTPAPPSPSLFLTLSPPPPPHTHTRPYTLTKTTLSLSHTHRQTDRADFQLNDKMHASPLYRSRGFRWGFEQIVIVV